MAFKYVKEPHHLLMLREHSLRQKEGYQTIDTNDTVEHGIELGNAQASSATASKAAANNIEENVNNDPHLQSTRPHSPSRSRSRSHSAAAHMQLSDPSTLHHHSHHKEPSISPWRNLPAMLIGGFGSFLNSCCYSGIALLIPLVLMEHSFGIVSQDPDEHGEGKAVNK